MSGSGGRGRRTIEVAEEVARSLSSLGIDSAVIGAMALAVHGYLRSTRDFDLATHVDPFERLPRAQKAIAAAGWTVELRTPDADDPLGGLLEVKGKGIKPIEIVNFFNPLASSRSALGEAAIRAAEAGRIEGSRLRVVDLPHLIALKLYAGGARSKSDIVELLERNPNLSLDAVRGVCTRHGLQRDLESILADLGR